MSGNGKQGKILVIGGGISGITVAIEAAEAGCSIVLVEKNAYLGGRVAQSNKYFPKLCPPMCGLEISLRRLRANGRIQCHTLAEVEKIVGEPGNYRATIKHYPRHVNENCTACGACVDVCPVERSNVFNYGLDKTKAIYLPFEAVYPQRFVIDGGVCEGTSCSKCVEACQYNAVDLEEKPRTEEVEVGAVVFATGWQPYDAAQIENLGFGQYSNVITNSIMERLAAANGPTEGRITRPSDGKEIDSVAFVQCAGSRDENYLKHCSGVCCLASLKQATYIREQYPETQIFIFYIDVRAPGRLEDFYAARQEDEKLSIVKGKVAKIEEDPATQDLVVEAEDVFGGGRVSQRVNLVVLATGIVPSEVGVDVPNGLIRDEHGFLVAEQNQPGLLVAGCAKRPVDVSACMRDATGTALKALQNCV
ncbi:MAG: FAD-dependent oxidoreductase [Candidatus Latescibacteria bacterium]|nr:FAD-dependent oxidoreductase [Candidatus Latescibacterota bacterium]NIO55247.1 FAD-dependent oxidoreductase [Candidatus Latescibacterota bacterium]